GYQIPDMSYPVASTNSPATTNPMVNSPRQESVSAPATMNGMERSVAANRAPAPVPVEDPNKPQAKRLLAEAHQAHQMGNLVEARLKALQAQRLKVQFSVEEERPEMVLLQLTEAAKKQVDALCHTATDYTGTADR